MGKLELCLLEYFTEDYCSFESIECLDAYLYEGTDPQCKQAYKNSSKKHSFAILEKLLDDDGCVHKKPKVKTLNHRRQERSDYVQRKMHYSKRPYLV